MQAGALWNGEKENIRWNMKQYRKTYTWVLGVLVGAGLVYAGAWMLAEKPPLVQVAAAREALADARKVQAPVYATAEYEAARSGWEATLATWQAENKRWFLLRDYASVASHAGQAAEAGHRARTKAIRAYDSLRWVSLIESKPLHDQLTRLKAQMRHYPASEGRRQELNQAQKLLVQGDVASERGDFLTAAARVQQVRDLLLPLGAHLNSTLSTYLDQLPLWQRWVEEAVQQGHRSGRPVLIVDKMTRRLLVYQNEAVTHTFEVELGPNWMGQKTHQGDLSTPEGQYRITRKLDRGVSIYHRALLINYPNSEDQRRFDQARREGTLPRSARIGGNIEIHGEGGRGVDWTRGCVALRNSDMDTLFHLVALDTPVIIVGALTQPSFLAEEAAKATPHGETR